MRFDVIPTDCIPAFFNAAIVIQFSSVLMTTMTTTLT